jgi:hypothetical protein
MEIDLNAIYYDPRTKTIFTVKRILPSCVELGGGSSPYLSDSRTNTMRHIVMHKYFEGFQKIDENSPLVHHDGIGFLLKDEGRFIEWDGAHRKLIYKEGFRINGCVETLLKAGNER